MVQPKKLTKRQKAAAEKKAKLAAAAAEKAIEVKKEEEGPPPKKIKMKISLANMRGSFERGHVYDVPRDVPEDTAKSWVGSGAADKVE